MDAKIIIMLVCFGLAALFISVAFWGNDDDS
jgi:hypothetical protein